VRLAIKEREMSEMSGTAKAVGEDPFDLARFVAAQNAGNTYQQAVAELRNGRKVSHWMWFVFPQIAGLGRSALAQRYAIGSLAEARAFRTHPVLGPRLLESAAVVLSITGRTARDIFGGIDAVKLRSSMTLFARADPDEPVFRDVLSKYFDDATDPATEQLLS
jgi:uncharacterized protein (DUF1810 family)